MQNKKWLILIIFGLCLISLSIIVPIGKSTILFEDLSSSKQWTLIVELRIIFRLLISFVDV